MSTAIDKIVDGFPFSTIALRYEPVTQAPIRDATTVQLISLHGLVLRDEISVGFGIRSALLDQTKDFLRRSKKRTIEQAGCMT